MLSVLWIPWVHPNEIYFVILFRLDRYRLKIWQIAKNNLNMFVRVTWSGLFHSYFANPTHSHSYTECSTVTRAPFLHSADSKENLYQHRYGPKLVADSLHSHWGNPSDRFEDELPKITSIIWNMWRDREGWSTFFQSSHVRREPSWIDTIQENIAGHIIQFNHSHGSHGWAAARGHHGYCELKSICWRKLAKLICPYLSEKQLHNKYGTWETMGNTSNLVMVIRRHVQMEAKKSDHVSLHCNQINKSATTGEIEG